MYEIVKLVATSHGYTVRQTEYPLTKRQAALELVAELTNDAIDNKSDGRWTIIPVAYHGRPFKPDGGL